MAVTSAVKEMDLSSGTLFGDYVKWNPFMMDDMLKGQANVPFGRLRPSSLVDPTPFPGCKRKANVANIDLDLDEEDCGPPTKQFAGDNEAIDDILQSSFFADSVNQSASLKYDGMSLPTTENTEQPWDCGNVPVVLCGKRPIDSTESNELIAIKRLKLDDINQSDGESKADLASKPSLLSPSMLNLPSNKSVSLILSDEIQESLTRRKLNEALLLPKLIDDQAKLANSMALVLWKPPVVGPFDFPRETVSTAPPSHAGVLQRLASSASPKYLAASNLSSPAEIPPAMENPVQIPRPSLSLRLAVDEEDCVEMDTAS